MEANPDLSDDTFTRTTRVHDWRTHVPDSVVKRWAALSMHDRWLVHEVADHAADAEEWD